MKMLVKIFLFIFALCLINYSNISISDDGQDNNTDRILMKGFDLESIQNIEFSKSNPNVLNIKYKEIDNYKYYRYISDNILFIENEFYIDDKRNNNGILLNLESMQGSYLNTSYLYRIFCFKNLLFYIDYVFAQYGGVTDCILLIINNKSMKTDSSFFKSINIIGQNENAIYFKVVREDDVFKNDTTILKYENDKGIDLKDTLMKLGYNISKIKYIDDDIIISDYENGNTKNSTENLISIKSNQFEISTDMLFFTGSLRYYGIERYYKQGNSHYFINFFETDSIYLPKISKNIKISVQYHKLGSIDKSGNLADIIKTLMFYSDSYIFDYRKFDKYLVIKFSEYTNDIKSNLYHSKSKFPNDSLALYDMSLRKFIDIDSFNLDLQTKHINLNDFKLVK